MENIISVLMIVFTLVAVMYSPPKVEEVEKEEEKPIYSTPKVKRVYVKAYWRVDNRAQTG